MKLLILILSILLPGCAGMTAFVQGHAPQIAAFSLVAGAVAAGTGAVSGVLEVKDQLTNDKEK